MKAIGAIIQTGGVHKGKALEFECLRQMGME